MGSYLNKMDISIIKLTENKIINDANIIKVG